MLYLFRIISDEDTEFYRDILADGHDTFLDVHTTLQANLGYDPSQLASFFLTTEDWEKIKEITLIDMMADPSAPALTMDQARIEDLMESDNQRMLYVFDFFSERALFIELIETFDKTSHKPTPVITSEHGKAPAQLIFLLDNDAPDNAGQSGDLGSLNGFDDPDDPDAPDFISFGDDFPEPDNPDY